MLDITLYVRLLNQGWLRQ